MDLEDLSHKAQALTSQGKNILALVGSACTTSTGAFDPLQGMADWAEANDVWFHVDGAHGAPVAFSETHRHLVQGMNRAQSVVMDFHKLCGLPALCTGVFYRDRGQSFLPFLQEAEYLWSDAAQKDWWDTGKRTLECTKRMLSTRLMSLRSGPGYDIWGTLVDRLWEVASCFAAEIRHREGWELAMTPQANIVCFRPKAFQKLTAAEIQAHRATYLRNGSGYVVSTTIHGERWLRCTFMNPLTEAQDLREMLAQWDDILAAD
jgi:L-2,4-diaminobutyrate decarboxylase